MNPSDFEFYRNKTILFFYEKILEKDGQRSMHDLSCQFGRKEFSKEMKQIAGSSRNGLKMFLMSYPSLFVIEGDIVFLSEPNNTRVQITSRLDCYKDEAKKYFEEKILQYGKNAEVPIKCLFGHRSQANLSIRYMAGQTCEDFKHFLMSFPNTFILNNNNVRHRSNSQISLDSSFPIISEDKKKLQSDGDGSDRLQTSCIDSLKEKLAKEADTIFLTNKEIKLLR